MLVYKPNTILIPDNIIQHESVVAPFLENIRNWMISPYNVLTPVYRATDTKDFKKASIEEKLKYIREIKGIPYFYDVFLSFRKNNRCYLIALIANQPLNKIMSPPDIFCNGNRYEHKSSVLKGKVNFLIVDVSDEAIKNDWPLKIEFKWANEEIQFSRCIDLFPNPWQDSKPELTLSTLQKDNPKEWIRDWIYYHHRIHNVKRVLLYDNMSQNVSELEEYLRCIEDDNKDLSIALINWNMAYNSPADPYRPIAQSGQLHHSYYWLWNKISWIINIDIDEYLINRNKESLSQYLHRYRFCNTFNIVQRCASAACLDSVSKDSSKAVTDYHWFYSHSSNKNPASLAPKNIIRGSQGRISIEVHKSPTLDYVNPTSLDQALSGKKLPKNELKDMNMMGFSEGLRKGISDTRYLRYSFKPHIALHILQEKLHKKIFDKYSLMKHRQILLKYQKINFILKDIISSRPMEWGLYFNHYKNLNNGWKYPPKDINYSQLSSAEKAELEEDKFVMKLFKKARVGKYYKSS